jgi:hypothetical protein
MRRSWYSSHNAWNLITCIFTQYICVLLFGNESFAPNIYHVLIIVLYLSVKSEPYVTSEGRFVK